MKITHHVEGSPNGLRVEDLSDDYSTVELHNFNVDYGPKEDPKTLAAVTAREGTMVPSD